MNETPITASNFPRLTSADHRWVRKEHTAQAINDLGRAMAEGSIPNPAYKEIKEILNRAVEGAWEAQISAVHFRRADEDAMPPEVRSFHWSVSVYSMHNIIAVHKKLTSPKAMALDHPSITAMREFATEMLPLAQALADMKDKAVKRHIKTDAEREAEDKFIPPLPSEKAAFAVYETLKEITRVNSESLKSEFVREYTRDLDRFIEREQTRTNKDSVSMGYPVSHLVEQDPATRILTYSARRYIAKPDAPQIIERLAATDAERIQERFISKNLKKIASIVDAKGFNNMKEIKTISHTVSLAGLRGTIRVEFKDGSGFTANNSVVHSYSVHGNPFLRWPLTFHNVILPSGKPMPSPSEERMHAIFKCATATSENAAEQGADAPRDRRKDIEAELAEHGLRLDLAPDAAQRCAIVDIASGEVIDESVSQLEPEVAALIEEWSSLSAATSDDGDSIGPSM